MIPKKIVLNTREILLSLILISLRCTIFRAFQLSILRIIYMYFHYIAITNLSEEICGLDLDKFYNKVYTSYFLFNYN